MVEVHSTAIVRGVVEWADDVDVGPYCVIDGTLGPVRIGAGTCLIGHTWLAGPLSLGAGNTIYPSCQLGLSPQSRSFDPSTPGRGITIGDRNVFREQATVHRASTDQHPTTIGSDNYFMSCTHVGHDCRIANNCTIASGAVLGGHVLVDDDATIGGLAAIHQFTRIGRGAMIGGGLASRNDVPPFFMLTENGIVGSVNAVGLRRRMTDSQLIEDIRWVFRTLYRRRLPVSAAVTELKTRADRPIVAEYIEFISSSKRGITSGGHACKTRA